MDDELDDVDLNAQPLSNGDMDDIINDDAYYDAPDIDDETLDSDVIDDSENPARLTTMRDMLKR